MWFTTELTKRKKVLAYVKLLTFVLFVSVMVRKILTCKRCGVGFFRPKKVCKL
jgi:hypothetical protein